MTLDFRGKFNTKQPTHQILNFSGKSEMVIGEMHLEIGLGSGHPLARHLLHAIRGLQRWKQSRMNTHFLDKSSLESVIKFFQEKLDEPLSNILKITFKMGERVKKKKFITKQKVNRKIKRFIDTNKNTLMEI